MKKFVLILILILISIDFAVGVMQESMISGNTYLQQSQNYQQNEIPQEIPYVSDSSVSGFPAGFPQTPVAGPAYASIAPQNLEAYLPPGAPTPPDPNGESLVLPDFNMLKPGRVQVSYPPQSFSGNYQGVYPQPAMTAPPIASPTAPSIAPPIAPPMTPPVQGCANCRGQGCIGCNGLTMTSGCQVIYPHPSIYKCNNYYVQIQPGKLCTEAGIWCGEFLPLWSKIGRPGTYWSYEWAQCGASYCYPEVKNFGYKDIGWYQTMFRSNRPGWHILSYWSNDWSNYIYIYVWPTE